MRLENKKAIVTGPNEKVDIAELDWEDRERVLRLLFCRILTNSCM